MNATGLAGGFVRISLTASRPSKQARRRSLTLALAAVLALVEVPSTLSVVRAHTAMTTLERR